MKTAYSKLNDRLGLSIIRFTIIGIMLALTTACAPQSGEYLLAQRAETGPACPAQSVRTCEVIGGNKFKKRYGRCVCSRQLYSPARLN